MCVKVEDVINDVKYISLYYPLDEAIQNNGDLILVHPKYCPHFSNILNKLKKVLIGRNSMYPDEIPDEEYIQNKLLSMVENDTINHIQEIIVLVNLRVKRVSCSDDDVKGIVLELINKVINATLGDRMRKYRTDALLRVNTVAFRTELAVKSEKK